MAPPHPYESSRSWPFDVTTAGTVPVWLRYLMAHRTYTLSSTPNHERRAPAISTASATASVASTSAVSSGTETFKTCASMIEKDKKQDDVPDEAVAWAPTLACALLALFLTVVLALAAVATTHVSYPVSPPSATVAADLEEAGGKLLDPEAFKPKRTSLSHKEAFAAAVTTPATSSPRPTTKRASQPPSKSLQHAPEVHNGTYSFFTATASALTTTKDRRNKNKTQPVCAEVFYMHCLRARAEFHYDVGSHECVATDRREDQLCARGVNRFTSEASCTRSCVRTRHPEQRCFATPVFSVCDRRDVKGPQWNFDGRDCRRWHFPRGQCPPGGSTAQNVRRTPHLFTTYDECLETCLTPLLDRVNMVKEAPISGIGCAEILSARTCTEDQLRYPYFAAVGRHEAGNVRLWCLPVTSAFPLPGHRCLLGSNRFGTRTSCQRACAENEA